MPSNSPTSPLAPHVWLELDCTVEDTPRWRRLIEDFDNLLPSEQKWALAEALRVARRTFSRMDDRPARVEALFEYARKWVFGSSGRRAKTLAANSARWALHPWGRLGECRKEAFRRAFFLLRPEQRRREAWRNFIVLAQVGPGPLESILQSVSRGMEAEALEQAAAGSARGSQRKRRAARIAFFPIYATAWVAGAARAQWAQGRDDGAASRAQKPKAQPVEPKRGPRRL